MAIQIKKAKREAVKVKIGMMGISGSGKTLSALLIAYGLLKAEHPDWTDAQIWDHVLVIDTENQSSSLYAGLHVGSDTVGEFLTIDIEAPYTVEKYTQAIDAAQEAGVEFLIIDSMSHAWQGEGGMLDKQNIVANRTKNTYTAWREITPEFNKLMEKILQCPMHVVSTYRGKKEYAMEEENGKKKVTPKGVGAQFRDGADYESTIYFEIDQDHKAYASKDRTHLFDGQMFIISSDTGKRIYQWLSTASHEEPKVVKAVAAKENVVAAPVEEDPTPEEAEKIAAAMLKVDEVIKAAVPNIPRDEMAAKIKAIAGTANYKKVRDLNVLRELYKAFAN